MPTVWRVPGIGINADWEGELGAYWEVAFDPISDNYTPIDISALELFEVWVNEVRTKFSEDLIPIHWYVRAKSGLERFPFQYHTAGAPDDFLTHYGWPVDAETGEELNWLTLPVVDKLWNERRMNKGGFIQEATKWKPSILQPYVFLPTLINATGAW